MTVLPAWRRPSRSVGNPPWTPASITTAVWLDANDASSLTIVSNAVSQWNDKSGTSRHLSQSTASQRPAYNATGYLSSLPLITFDGSNDILTATSGSTGIANVSMFMAMRYVTATGEDLAFGFGTSGNGSAIRYLYTTGSSQGFATWGNDVVSSSLSLDAAGSFHIFEVVQSGTSVSLWRDGSPDSVLPRTIVAPSNISTNTIGLGGINGSGSYYANIAVLEAIALYEAATTTTRQLIEGYLAWKWSLVASLPSDHPYKFSPPTL